VGVVRRGNDPSDPCLADRIRDALANWCADVTREGGLSLGESSYLVDAISCRQSPPSEKEMVFLIPDKMTGFYSLPVWVDHANPLNTVPWRFRLSEPMPVEDGLKTAWFQIGEHQ
jgi:CRISPR-associated protein Cas5t